MILAFQNVFFFDFSNIYSWWNFGASLDLIHLDSSFSFNVTVSRKRNQVNAKNSIAAVSSVLYSDGASTLVSRDQCLPTLECPFEWKPGARALPQRESEWAGQKRHCRKEQWSCTYTDTIAHDTSYQHPCFLGFYWAKQVNETNSSSASNCVCQCMHIYVLWFKAVPMLMRFLLGSRVIDFSAEFIHSWKSVGERFWQIFFARFVLRGCCSSKFLPLRSFKAGISCWCSSPQKSACLTPIIFLFFGSTLH